MKKTIYYVIFLTILNIVSSSVIAQTVKIHYYTQDTQENSIKVVLENNNEYYADSNGLVTISDLVPGQSYASKVYYQHYDKKLKTRVEMSIINPLIKSDNLSTFNPELVDDSFVCNNGQCVNTYHIYL
jgi:hypothetical protein